MPVEVRTGNLEGEAYNFISRIFARQYENKNAPAQKVFLVVLDAGNFHYPKVCFRGVGFTPEELPSRELNIGTGKLNVHLLLNKKGKEEYLSIYWICIDKKIIPTWAQQKARQLFYSLFNKERTGLMVRADIPVVGDDIGKTVGVAQGFLNEIYEESSTEYREYVFGAQVHKGQEHK